MDLNAKIKERSAARAKAMMDELQARVWDAARSISAKQSNGAVSPERLIKLYVLRLQNNEAAKEVEAAIVESLTEKIARLMIDAAAEGLKQDPETYYNEPH